MLPLLLPSGRPKEALSPFSPPTFLIISSKQTNILPKKQTNICFFGSTLLLCQAARSADDARQMCCHGYQPRSKMHVFYLVILGFWVSVSVSCCCSFHTVLEGFGPYFKRIVKCQSRKQPVTNLCFTKALKC